MNAREIIIKADEIRREQNLSQAGWSRAAGLDEGGMAVSRTYNRGNCKLSTIVRLLRPLGYELRIEKVINPEDMP